MKYKGKKTVFMIIVIVVFLSQSILINVEGFAPWKPQVKDGM